MDKILLHRPPIVFVDEVVACHDLGVVTRKTFNTGDYGTRDEYVSEPALIECMAQAMAAQRGQIAFENNLDPEPGMLVGVQNVTIHGEASCGLPLDIHADITHKVGAFYLADCRVLQDSVVVATGTLKFFVGEVPE